MPIFNKLSGTTSFVLSVVFAVSVIFSGSYAMVSLFDNISSKGLDYYSTFSYDDVNEILNDTTGISIETDVLSSKLFTGIKDIIYGFTNEENYTIEDAGVDAENLINETLGSTDAMNEVNNFISDLKGKVDGLLDKTDVDEKIKEYVESEIELIEP